MLEALISFFFGIVGVAAGAAAVAGFSLSMR